MSNSRELISYVVQRVNDDKYSLQVDHGDAEIDLFGADARGNSDRISVCVQRKPIIF